MAADFFHARRDFHQGLLVCHLSTAVDICWSEIN